MANESLLFEIPKTVTYVFLRKIKQPAEFIKIIQMGRKMMRNQNTLIHQVFKTIFMNLI